MAYSPEDQRALAVSRRAATGAAGSGVQSALGRPAPRQVTPRARNPRASYGGGRAPAPRVRSSSGGQYSRPVPVPATGPGPVPDINAFLNADTAYNSQIRTFQQALADMRADVTRRRGSLESEHGLSKKALGDQRTLDLKNLEADYGSRGLLRSGLYGQAVGDYEREYGTRVSDLDRRQTDALSQLAQELAQFEANQKLEEQAAREAAVRRRAEQFGV
jgi:hypothetical protein